MLHVCCFHNRHLELYPVGLGIGQPRPQDCPQGLLAFQYGGRRREEDPNKGRVPPWGVLYDFSGGDVLLEPWNP